jgi:Ribosomal protein L30p/L7e
MVKSLGLRRLQRVIELPDTPSVRGLVAQIPHLVQIVQPGQKPGWFSVPEYSIREPERQTSSIAGEPSPEGLHGRPAELAVPDESASGRPQGVLENESDVPADSTKSQG